MTMGAEEAQTEKLIKEKAKILFFQRGFLNATTQEIADEAGVNRALIHYYFRSRELMLDTLLDETLMEKKERTRNILSSDLPFREKIARYIDTVVDYGLKYPYLENFIISETARHPDKIREFCSKAKIKSSDLIRVQLEAEIKKKKIAPISPEHFMVNLSALCNYPLLAKSVLQTIHGMTDTSYRKFLIERKQIIFMTIFNEEMPEISNTKKEQNKSRT
jgi:TetR/AcrR family transcriptional regulator